MTEFNPEFMKRAIELSDQAIKEGTGGPFGAVIVKDNKIIAEGYNKVVSTNDPTHHAEIEAIKNASKVFDSPHMDGCIMYTSAECCPMCFGACMWSHISKIYYGATMKDALKYGNFQDYDILNELKKDESVRKIPSFCNMRDEAVVVWKEYHAMVDKKHY